MANFSDALVKTTLWKDDKQVGIPKEGIQKILNTSYQNEGIHHNDTLFYLTGRHSIINMFEYKDNRELLQWLFDNKYERAIFDFAEIEQDSKFALHGLLDVNIHQTKKLIHITSESIEWEPEAFNKVHALKPFPVCDENDNDAMDDMVDDFNEAYDVIQSTILDQYVGKTSPRHYNKSDGEYTYDSQFIHMN